VVTLALALVVQTSITRVDSVLAAGDVRQALKLATKIVQQRPRDPAAHMLLGRVHYARPVVGRFPALEEFRTAARLAPNDPEPLYWQMQVGFYLRGEEYSAQLEAFTEAIRTGNMAHENSFASAYETDRVVEMILQANKAKD